MTAIEWLIHQYIKDGLFKKGIYEQALEMEKQQIKEAYCQGDDNVGAEQYYNETYGSKKHYDDMSDKEIEEWGME